MDGTAVEGVAVDGACDGATVGASVGRGVGQPLSELFPAKRKKRPPPAAPTLLQSSSLQTAAKVTLKPDRGALSKRSMTARFD